MRQNKSHVIDSVFPITLFFVFAASALLVLMLATHIYEETTVNASSNFDTRTSYSYITEKIRQNDENGQISVEDFDDITCLVLANKSNGFSTYIYAFDGQLKELRMRQGLDFDPSAGTDLMECKSFMPEMISDKVISLSFTGSDDKLLTTYVTERSENE